MPVSPPPADLWLFAGSCLGLLLVPAALGRAAWLFPAAFAALGLFLLGAPEGLHPGRNAWIWLLLSQGPWLLLIPDLFARGRAARALDPVPLRALLAWSLLHVIGLRHVAVALIGFLPAGFALEIASGSLLTLCGALFLWLVHRPGRPWFRFVALVWNAHAFVSVLAVSTRILRAHPGLPAGGAPAPGIHAFFASWPGALEALFWIPLALCLHAAIFYKLVTRPAASAPPGHLPRPAASAPPGHLPRPAASVPPGHLPRSAASVPPGHLPDGSP